MDSRWVYFASLPVIARASSDDHKSRLIETNLRHVLCVLQIYPRGIAVNIHAYFATDRWTLSRGDKKSSLAV